MIKFVDGLSGIQKRLNYVQIYSTLEAFYSTQSHCLIPYKLCLFHINIPHNFTLSNLNPHNSTSYSTFNCIMWSISSTVSFLIPHISKNLWIYSTFLFHNSTNSNFIPQNFNLFHFQFHWVKQLIHCFNSYST